MKTLLLSLLALPLLAQNPSNQDLDVLGHFDMSLGTYSAPFIPVSVDPTGDCTRPNAVVINTTIGHGGQLTGCIGLIWTPLGGAGSGNVSGPGSSTNYALAAWNGTSGLLLRNTSVITDVSGNLTANSLVTSGGGAGTIELTQGTAQGSFPANSVSLYAPATVATAYQWKLPAADAAGVVASDGAGTPGTLSILSVPSCLDSSGNHLNYNSSTHVFSCGNTGGTAATVTFSGITGSTNTSAAMVLGTGSSLTTSGSGTNNATLLNGSTPGGTCTNQAVTSLSSSAVPTCTTLTSAYTSGTFSATAHNLLSATHGDTTASSAVRGGGIFAIGASPTWTQLAHSSATGGYFKWNGTDVVASTGAAGGTGSCTNQAVTAANADAAPTCTTLTSSYVDSSIAQTGTDINTSNQVTATHLAAALPVNQGGTGDISLTAYAPLLGGTTSTGVLQQTAVGTAKQIMVSGGSGAVPNYIDFPDVKIMPAANCIAGTAGGGWNNASSNFTATCRAGTNNLGGSDQAIPSTGASAQFLFELPLDWDTASQPYISIFYGAGANTSGTVIWTVSSACSKEDGSVSDDPAFNAESAFGSQTMAAANRMWAKNGQFTAITSGNNCIGGSSVIVKVALSGTAASAINAYQAIITTPRLLTVQAN